MKGLIREMWQVKGNPHGMVKQQTQAFPPKILKFANGGHTSQNQKREVYGGEKCPVGALDIFTEKDGPCQCLDYREPEAWMP